MQDCKETIFWWVFHFILFNLLYQATTWTLSPSFILWVYCYSSISHSVLTPALSIPSLEKQSINKRCKSSSEQSLPWDTGRECTVKEGGTEVFYLKWLPLQQGRFICVLCLYWNIQLSNTLKPKGLHGNNWICLLLHSEEKKKSYSLKFLRKMKSKWFLGISICKLCFMTYKAGV